MKNHIYILPFLIFIIGCSVFGDKKYLSSDFIKKWKEDSIACNSFRENNMTIILDFLKSQPIQKYNKKNIIKLLGKPNFDSSNSSKSYFCYGYLLENSSHCINGNLHNYAGIILIINFNKKNKVVSYQTIIAN